MFFSTLTLLLLPVPFPTTALPQNPSPSLELAARFSIHVGPIGPIASLLRPTSTTPSSSPTPTGNLLATIEYYDDDHCSQPVDNFQYYDGQEPRCQLLPGNSAMETFL